MTSIWMVVGVSWKVVGGADEGLAFCAHVSAPPNDF